MSIVIKQTNVASEHLVTMKKMLHMVPDIPVSKYNSFNKQATIPEPIIMYQTENEALHVPYLFAHVTLAKEHFIIPTYPATPLQFKGELRANQIEVELEAWEQIQKRGASTLGLYPGYGKTILGAKLASRIALLTVILVHREILTVQWKKTFTDFTNAKVWIVGEKTPPPSCDVIICMDSRWHHIPQRLRDAVGFLIIDEAHAFCTPTHVGCLLAFHPKYILAETATLLRDDGMHSMIQAIVGTHGVFRETSKPFTVMKVTTNVTPVRKMNRMGGVDYASLVSATLYDERRNKIIWHLVKSNPTFTILILTSLVDHAMLLHAGLVKVGESCDFMCGTKKSYHDCRVLIGTTSKIGTGFDQATACPDYSGKRFDLLILCCSIKKYAMLVQNVGRVFRADYPTVMYLVDNDTIFTSHWYKAQKWFKMHGGTIIKHDMPNPKQPEVKVSAAEVNDEWAKAAIARIQNTKKP